MSFSTDRVCTAMARRTLKQTIIFTDHAVKGKARRTDMSRISQVFAVLYPEYILSLTAIERKSSQERRRPTSYSRCVGLISRRKTALHICMSISPIAVGYMSGLEIAEVDGDGEVT